MIELCLNCVVDTYLNKKSVTKKGNKEIVFPKKVINLTTKLDVTTVKNRVDIAIAIRDNLENRLLASIK